MGLFDFLRKPNGETKEEIKKAKAQPNVFSIDGGYGLETTVFNLKTAKKFVHRDGSVSCLVTARVINNKVGDTILFDNADFVCFEVPDGRMDLARNIIEKSYFEPINEEKYVYIGRAYNDEDIRLQQPTPAVQNEINQLNQRLKEELENKRLQQEISDEEKKQRDAESLAKTMQQIDRNQEYAQSEKEERLTHPFIKGGISKVYGEQYDGVNMISGEILRIRNVHKVVKDMAGTYIYTADLSSTDNLHDVEYLSGNAGNMVPVVFTLPYRMNDIINSDYDSNYKARLESALLGLLSDGYEKGMQMSRARGENGVLYDIGGIDKNGVQASNDNRNVSANIVNKIAEMQRQYFRQNRESQDSLDY